MDQSKLKNFLAMARFNTYASNEGKVEKPAFPGSYQLEYKEGDWFYRDLYYNGNGIFTGVEVIYFKEKPAWSMSYFGNYKKITEEEIDRILRKALKEYCKTTRLGEKIETTHDGYTYTCQPDENSTIEELSGNENVTKNGKTLYFFYYAGGLLIK